MKRQIRFLFILLTAILVVLPANGCRDRSRAHKNIARLNFKKNPNPAERIAAIRDMAQHAHEDFNYSGWQNIQTTSLRDPDPSVRIAALHGLADIADESPDSVSQPGFGKHNVWGFLDLKRIGEISLKDSSPEVRKAAAEFWRRADIEWKSGTNFLTKMLEKELDTAVAVVARESLAILLERCYFYREIPAEPARALQKQYLLRELSLQGYGKRSHSNKFGYEYLSRTNH
jgi:hypothetical protein